GRKRPLFRCFSRGHLPQTAFCKPLTMATSARGGHYGWRASKSPEIAGEKASSEATRENPRKSAENCPKMMLSRGHLSALCSPLSTLHSLLPWPGAAVEVVQGGLRFLRDAGFRDAASELLDDLAGFFAADPLENPDRPDGIMRRSYRIRPAS